MKFIPPSAFTTFAAIAAVASFGIGCATTQPSTATTPAPRDANWVKRHEGFVADAAKSDTQVVFFGDSITDGWRGNGKAVWEKEFAPLKALNFGIGGDRTQHVLWRLQNGEAGKLKPKAVVLMIGTNNTGKERDGAVRNTTPEIIGGVRAVVNELRTRFPGAKILLLAVFPRGEKDSPQRAQVAEVNRGLARFHTGNWVHYLDIGPKFLQPDGTLTREIMPDLLHLSPAGYQIWADAIRGPLAKLMN